MFGECDVKITLELQIRSPFGATRKVKDQQPEDTAKYKNPSSNVVLWEEKLSWNNPLISPKNEHRMGEKPLQLVTRN